MNPFSNQFLNFLSLYTVKKFKHRQIIHFQGQVPSGVHIIKQGVVRAFTITDQGDERTITLFTEGDILNIGWVFEIAPVALYYYEAFTDCSLYSVPKQELIDFIHMDPKTLAKILDRYVTLFVIATLQINALEQPSAQDKILRTLQFLIMRHGKLTENGLTSIDLKLTHQDIGNMTGLARETVAIELNKLKSKKVLSYRHKNYTLKPEDLLKLLGSDEFTNLKL